MKEQSKTEQKKPWLKPEVRTQVATGGASLLTCTGQYNCKGEVGFDCCQPTSADCGSC